jgi:hypothetical protein
MAGSDDECSVSSSLCYFIRHADILLSSLMFDVSMSSSLFQLVWRWVWRVVADSTFDDIKCFWGIFFYYIEVQEDNNTIY